MPGHAVFLGSAVLAIGPSWIKRRIASARAGRSDWRRRQSSMMRSCVCVIIKVHAGGVPFARFPHVAVMRKMVPVVQLGVDAHFVAGRFLRPWLDVGRRARFQFFWGEKSQLVRSRFRSAGPNDVAG